MSRGDGSGPNGEGLDDFDDELDGLESLIPDLGEDEDEEDDDADFDEIAEADGEFRAAAEAVYLTLLERMGEGSPQPRLGAVRRAVELLGDPQRAYPIIHVTGTNGKTTTSRITESILRAYGLRTGLFTSPHLQRLNERIVVDGEPISDRMLAANWADVDPFLTIVDAELASAGEAPLTFFEALTVLAFACFADAPVDVAVIEVGMGGEWDSTNVADGQVAVFTPIALDHTQRLGSTVAEIARTKSGIIKPVAQVVTARQDADALAELRRAAQMSESSLAIADEAFAVTARTPGVGGQLLSIRGIAAQYDNLFLPLYGEHQAENAAVAVAAVESFLGGGVNALVRDVVEEGFAEVTSPGRMQLVGTDPTVLVDAAHNPHSAAALVRAVKENFSFERIVVVLGVLSDKDAAGIIDQLKDLADEFVVTQSHSERAIEADELASLVVAAAGAERVLVEPDIRTACLSARELAAEGDNACVVITGSITLVAEASALAEEEGWKA